MSLMNGVRNDLWKWSAINMYTDAREEYWGEDRDPYRILSRDFQEQQRRDSLYNAQVAVFKEVQFDCDWTESTRVQYFAFLRESRKLFSGWRVSSTVRLYQYKYPEKAGVPPIERGMRCNPPAPTVFSTPTSFALLKA